MAATNEIGIQEAADRAGVSTRTVWSWIRVGLKGRKGRRVQLKARKFGQSWLIDPAALDDFSRRLTEAALSK